MNVSALKSSLLFSGIVFVSFLMVWCGTDTKTPLVSGDVVALSYELSWEGKEVFASTLDEDALVASDSIVAKALEWNVSLSSQWVVTRELIGKTVGEKIEWILTPTDLWQSRAYDTYRVQKIAREVFEFQDVEPMIGASYKASKAEWVITAIGEDFIDVDFNKRETRQDVYYKIVIDEKIDAS